MLLTGFFTGAVLALQSGLTLDQFGARPVVGRLVSASMIKELGPVLTALMLTGRVGSGIAAELGSMVVTDQINALRALGTDPIRKLVVPRVLAGFLMAPVLTVISDFVGIVGGWIVARVPAAGGLERLLDVGRRGAVHAGRLDGPHQAVRARLRDRDHRAATSACGRRGGTQGVGTATTDAVVAGSVAVIAVDFFVTQLLISAAVLTWATPTRTRDAGTAREIIDARARRSSSSTRVSLAFDDKVVLHDVSFTLLAGHTKIILGASGAGKSTILKIILGLLQAGRRARSG